MPTLLHIDSSPLGGNASFSRQLTAEFVGNWQRANPGGNVISRDLAATDLAPINAEWIGAVFTPEEARTERQREVLRISNELIGELETADEYVFGVPMHNFAVPGVLKLWVDQIVRAGKTFSYETGAPVGLLRNKKATFLLASGAVYTPDSPLAALNFVEPYLRSMFGFLGVTDTTFISAGGTARLRSGVARETILQPALESVRAQFEGAEV